MDTSAGRSGDTGWTRTERASGARLRAVLAAAVAAVLLGLITHGHYAGSGDAVHYMMIARSIVVGGDVDLGDDYGEPTNILSTPAERHALPGRGGALRPVHDLGLPVLASPYFAAAYRLADWTDGLPESLRRRAKLDRFIALRQLVSLFMIGLTAWLALVFFETSWSLTGLKSESWLWALVWTLSPPILSHGYVFLTEVPTALLALLAYRHREAISGTAPRALGLGAMTGLLVLVHVRNVGLVLGLVALSLWRIRGHLTRALPYLAGLSLAGAVKIGLNLLFWGTILTTPHAQLGAWPGIAAAADTMLERFVGLLMDARHGLIPLAPIYLAAPAAWVVLWHRSRTTAVELLTIAACYLAFVLMPMTNVHGWRGGWSPAARFLVPIAPFLALGVPTLMTGRLGRGLVVALLCVQLPLNAFLWGHPMLTWSEGSGPSPVVEALLGGGFAGRLPGIDTISTAAMLACLGAIALWSIGSAAMFRPGRSA